MAYKKYKSKSTLSSKVNNLSKKISKLSKASELKQRTTAFVAAPTNVLPVINHLTQCDQGDSSSQRDGEVVSPERLHISGRLVASVTGGQCQLFRMIVLQDNQQSDGVSPTPFEIFGTSTPTINETYQYLNRRRFKILWDHTFGVEPDTNAVNAGAGKYPNRMHIKKWLNLPKKPITYSGVASSVNKNGVYMVTLSEQSAPPSFTYLCGYQFRG